MGASRHTKCLLRQFAELSFPSKVVSSNIAPPCVVVDGGTERKREKLRGFCFAWEYTAKAQRYLAKCRARLSVRGRQKRKTRKQLFTM